MKKQKIVLYGFRLDNEPLDQAMACGLFKTKAKAQKEFLKHLFYENFADVKKAILFKVEIKDIKETKIV